MNNKNSQTKTNKDSKHVTIQVTHIFNLKGQRLCTCGSDRPWWQCGDSPYCG